ncbi:MAG TPA: aldo/keto reductase, partial [Actinopolymorphaceae bacterium]|nr:aldo/keto reductase [Actinopolymorphaceae bacterium]
SPLARGLLTGSRGRGGEKRTVRARSDSFGDSLYGESAFTIVDRVAEIAAKHDVPPAQIALAWLLHQDAVTAPIVGATKPGHVDDAVAAVDVTLSADELTALEELYEPRPIAGHG